MSYTHFTLDERKYLQKLLAEGCKIRQIARILERSPSSVSREIRRNRSEHPRQPSDNRFNYNHWRATILATRRKRCRRLTALPKDSEQYNFVLDHIKLYWSPETIAARFNREHPNNPISMSTIYRRIRQHEFPMICAKTHLRRRGKIIRPRNSNYNSIQPDRIIPQWTDEIKNRETVGHWEGDTVYGAIGKGYLVTLVDRKSRFLCARIVRSRSAQQTRLAVEQALANNPVCSISFDNGSEFSQFHELEQNLDTLVYFAEPHKPWQRGTNENTNDLLRFFFPKGFDFSSLTDEKLQEAVSLINNRPRKCLGWLSPVEFLSSLGVALA